MAKKKDSLDKDLETAFKDRSYSEVEILSKHDFKTGRKLNKSNVDEYIPTPTKDFSESNVDEYTTPTKEMRNLCLTYMNKDVLRSLLMVLKKVNLFLVKVVVLLFRAQSLKELNNG
jgi:hypothetical protein